MEMNTGSLLWDFLSFRVLMTPAILVFVYYAGAILLPIPGFWLLNKLTQPAEGAELSGRKGHLRQSPIANYRGLIYFVAFIGFIIMEIFWRADLRLCPGRGGNARRD